MLQILQHALSHWNIPARRAAGRLSEPVATLAPARAGKGFRKPSLAPCAHPPARQHSDGAEVASEGEAPHVVRSSEETESKTVCPTHILLIAVVDQLDSAFYAEELEALERERSTVRVIHHIQEYSTAFVLPCPSAADRRQVKSTLQRGKDEAFTAGLSSGPVLDAVASSGCNSSQIRTPIHQSGPSHDGQFQGTGLCAYALAGPGASRSKGAWGPALSRQLSASQLLSRRGSRCRGVTSRLAGPVCSPVPPSALTDCARFSCVFGETEAPLIPETSIARHQVDGGDNITSSIPSSILETSKGRPGACSRSGFAAEEPGAAKVRQEASSRQPAGCTLAQP